MEQAGKIVFLILGFSCGLLVGYVVHVFSVRKYHRGRDKYRSYRRQKLRENIRLYLVMMLVAVILGWMLILVNEKATDFFHLTRQSVYNEHVHRTLYDRVRDSGLDEKDINKMIKEYRKRNQGR